MYSVRWAGGGPSGQPRYCTSTRTPAALSQSAVALPTGGMWPRNRTPSYNNTPFKQSTEERKAGPGGVSSYVSFSWRAARCQGILETVRVFEFRRFYTSGSAAAPGWCLHPLELHTGFCLGHASELARLVSIGWLAKGSAGLVETKLNVCRVKMNATYKSVKAQSKHFPTTEISSDSIRKCGEGLLPASKSAATVWTDCVPQHDNRNRSVMCIRLRQPNSFSICFALFPLRVCL